MREIKFRVWRKSWAMMVLPEWITKYLSDERGIYGVYFDLPCTDGHTENEEWDDVDDGDLVFMQYTDMDDKNGIRIAEGDIVKCQFAFGDNICEVIEEKGCYWVSQKNKDTKDKAHDNLYWHIDGIEVIGNIYENPELLNK
jgi:uncharacterized phage protein (TIGR01671 family)